MNAGRFALTGVALAASCLVSGQAWALGLGRLTVQSALGESLRAEIDVTSITPEEASTLTLRVASPDVYRSAGIDYNSVLPSAQVALQRRPDGRTVLRVTSDRAVVEPFLDVILEVNWASGRLVRAYTLLLDPPTTRPAPPVQAAAPTSPVVTPGPTPAPAPQRAAVPAPAPAPSAAPAKPSAPKTAAGPARADKVRVEAGDTLSRIASRVRPEGVSLEQMLVSLYRANPDAFVAENMNRLRAGSVLDVPAPESAQQIETAEARRVIQAQSADFSAYRQRLAGNVAPAPVAEAPARKTTGTVQAQVDDRKQAAPTPDQLKLSQGSAKASAPEAAVSRQTEQRDAAARVAELARNVEELKRLQGTAASAAAKPVPAAPAPAVVAAAPTPAPAAAPAASAAAPDATAVTASAPKPKPKPAPRPAPAPAPEPSFLDGLLENPLVVPGAGVLVALLVGLGVYRLRGRFRKPGGETSFLESRLQPDSFFGASGGQRIDTREAPSSTASSSMSYSLSQLDAIGDVDPVAEADVYLAYGRDLQAEEILKEAMRATPERQAIRVKLLEVYAKRRDTKGFELLATQVFSMTKGEGEDWEKAQELGRSIDPDNSLYQPGGQPEAVMMSGGEMVEPLAMTTLPASQKPASSLPPEVANLSTDLDLDLDVDLDAPTSPGSADISPTEMTQPFATGADMAGDQTLEFDLPRETGPGDLDFELPVTTEAHPRPSAPPASDFGGLDFDLEPPTAATERPAAASEFGDFQLSRSPDDAPPVSEYGSLTDDPLARKLELAEEFRQIGDMEGARDLLEEVIAKADGSLKAKAQGMLDRLA
ncbi:MAG: FimV family protein [Rubrivivax sp.]|nr:FimV family protein [Rubrivivax sp.]